MHSKKLIGQKSPREREAIHPSPPPFTSGPPLSRAKDRRLQGNNGVKTYVQETVRAYDLHRKSPDLKGRKC